jgi:hypothetical protein
MMLYWSDHLGKYFRISQSIKNQFSFHENINFTMWLRHIKYIYNIIIYLNLY